MKLIVAIPVFNERTYIERVLTEVKKYHSDILVVDDCSTDGTADLLSARADIHLVRHAKNMGYGRTVIDSFNWADQHGYDWIITLDADEQHEPSMILKFKEVIAEDRADLISGSRYMAESPVEQNAPNDRRSINRKMTQLINQTLDLQLTDTFCGFKAHRVCATTPLKLDETGYAFPMQLWPRAAAAKLRIEELPVHLIYNDPSRQFGGALNDAAVRLAHYQSVFQRELSRQPDPESCGCC